ncbi:hypothetical protein ADK75_23085 [Streptomyces virginiae]|uniref:Uncharacterized protein n=1 Tax=Streptomyces virginiae TaxID=1961 RepID=A0A0L8MB31_STRVG|nr:hypothetical protein ADK75_23085 [Streptomyces virginiae]
MDVVVGDEPEKEVGGEFPDLRAGLWVDAGDALAHPGSEQSRAGGRVLVAQAVVVHPILGVLCAGVGGRAGPGGKEVGDGQLRPGGGIGSARGHDAAFREAMAQAAAMVDRTTVAGV